MDKKFETVIVELPYRKTAMTHAFKITAHTGAFRDADTLIGLSGLDADGLATVHSVFISLSDLPLLLAGIRKVLAGPLERLLIEAEDYARTAKGE